MRAIFWVWLLVVFTVQLTACEYPGVSHHLAAAQTEKDSPRTAPTSQTEASPQPKNGQASNILQGTVMISLKDFKLDPDNLAVKAGAITFVLKNEGRYTHDFRVEGQGVNEKSPKVGSGRTIEWQITLEPGKYRISCPVSNHADRGMEGNLTVGS